MVTLTLTGWKKDVQVVSLIMAVKQYSTSSLAEAKPLIEELLAGNTVTLQFADDGRCEEFRRRAEALGATAE